MAAFFVPFEFHFSRERAYIHLQNLSLHGSRIHNVTILIGNRDVSPFLVIFKKNAAKLSQKLTLSLAIKVENIWLGTNVGRRSSRN